MWSDGRLPVVRTLLGLALLACAAGIYSAGAQTPGTVANDTGTTAAITPLPPGSWRFIVSGDSRNCGDVVMPAIAAHSAQFAPSFYWHLGDLRAIYKEDEDLALSKANEGHVPSCDTYERLAWSDFVENQIGAFGDLPFYLGIGNHEVIPYLDNAPGFFSDAQLSWLQHRLDNAKTDPAIKSIVVGMHEALPDSRANSHSMGDGKSGPNARLSGEKAYKALLSFRDDSHKPVYVLASHSHFYMENIFDTPQLTQNGVKPLPGWIVGTAGAVRYALPPDPPANARAKTDIYGYLLATVGSDGTIQFSYEQIHESDVPHHVRQRYPETLVPWCFAHNSQNKEPNAVDITPRCIPPQANSAH